MTNGKIEITKGHSFAEICRMALEKRYGMQIPMPKSVVKERKT